MARLEIIQAAGSNLLHSKRIWAIQLVVNPLLFAGFVSWLLLPVATDFHLLLNGLAIVLLVAAALVLHGGTLNFYSAEHQSDQPRVRDAFLNAARNVLAVASCAAAIYGLWALLDSTAQYQAELPAYLRSMLPQSVRRHVELWFFEVALEGIALAIRWVLIPGLILPLLLVAANSGFRAFAAAGIRALKNSLTCVGYWVILLIAAVAGLLAPLLLLEWTPEFRAPSVRLETFSLIARLSAAYILALASWLLVCALLGRLGRRAIAADAARNSAA